MAYQYFISRFDESQQERLRFRREEITALAFFPEVAISQICPLFLNWHKIKGIHRPPQKRKPGKEPGFFLGVEFNS
jgi:hypothetical protein